MLFEGSVLQIYKQTENWISMKVRLKSKETYIAKGKLTGLVFEKMNFTMEGNFVVDKKYGKQIEIKSFSSAISPQVSYFASCVKGVGPKLAEKIEKKFGTAAIDMIFDNPDILLEVPGIRPKKFIQISNSIKKLKKSGEYQLMLEIFRFFKGKCTENQAQKIREACQEKRTSINEIKKNPYVLITKIDGFGFKKVDSLALASGIKEDSVERLEAAVVDILKTEAETKGNTYTTLDVLSQKLVELILEKPKCLSDTTFQKLLSAIDDDNIELEEEIVIQDKTEEIKLFANKYKSLIDKGAEALLHDVQNNIIVYEDERVYWSRLYKAELNTARIVVESMDLAPVISVSSEDIEDGISYWEEKEGCEFSDEQKFAVSNSLSHRLSIITGGPGRGKTTILMAILKAWEYRLFREETKNEGKIFLLAPTGRAAKRMSAVTGYPAMTIHRFKKAVSLGITIKEEDLTNSLIIVDESSMLGIELGSDVLDFAEDANIIFIGDVDQLASISPGSFLKDLITSGRVSVSYLKKGFRNAGSIAKNSDLLNKGENLSKFIFDDDTVFLEREGEKLIPAIINFYDNALKEYKSSEIVILSPLKQLGYASVNNINKELQEHLHPSLKCKKNRTVFRMGDRVMNTSNDYNQSIINLETGMEELGVFNGDTGTIINIDEDSELMTVLFDDNKQGEFNFKQMQDTFILAYAMTVHKSQGSEYKAVLVVVSKQHSFFLKRNLLYTAMTRAKQFLFLLGSPSAVAIAAKKIDDSVRNSSLNEHINAIATHRLL